MATRKTITRFPKRELNTWLRKHLEWNHEEWNELIETLKSEGFETWTNNQEGRDQIGLYLESRRKQA